MAVCGVTTGRCSGEGRCRGNRPRRRRPGLLARREAVTEDSFDVAAGTGRHEDPEDHEKHGKKENVTNTGPLMQDRMSCPIWLTESCRQDAAQERCLRCCSMWSSDVFAWSVAVESVMEWLLLVSRGSPTSAGPQAESCSYFVLIAVSGIIVRGQGVCRGVARSVRMYTWLARETRASATTQPCCKVQAALAAS